MKSETRDVVIIGAGASGLMCAATCGRRGRSVLVLDHFQRTGAKIRISGGGRCNFTNLHAAPGHYRSGNAHFSTSALARFTPQDMLDLVGRHRVRFVEEEGGRIFCATGAGDILGLLEKECRQPGVEIRLKCGISKIAKAKGFTVTTDQGTFRSESLVIATGGLSYPRLGATGFGHDIARQFGLRVTELRPGLVPFTLSARMRGIYGALSGISVEATISVNDVAVRGNILFTHRGMSGPATLQASLAWERGRPITVDLLPGTDIHAIFRARRGSAAEMRNVLAGLLPRRLAQVWVEEAGGSRPLNQYADRDLRAMADGLHAWTFVPSGTEGYEIAEVTAGGVDTGGLSSKTMEARSVPGLYFIGEVVDVTGELGGYNLHWAWASGRAAGQYA